MSEPYDLNHNLTSGQRLEVTVNGVKKTDYTVPSGATLLVVAHEYRLVTAGQTVIAKVDGVTKLEYTVPAEHVIVITWEKVPLTE